MEKTAVFKWSQVSVAELLLQIAPNPALTLVPHRRGHSAVPQGNNTTIQGFSPQLRRCGLPAEGLQKVLECCRFAAGRLPLSPTSPGAKIGEGWKSLSGEVLRGEVWSWWFAIGHWHWTVNINLILPTVGSFLLPASTPALPIAFTH